MTIEDKIKKAFKKDKRINEVNKWDSATQPNLYELYNFLRKSGYTLIDVVVQKESNIEILLEPTKPGHLHPEISHDISDNNFYVKVNDYGLLVASDLEEIIKGYENALGVVNHLNSLSLDELEVDIDEE